MYLWFKVVKLIEKCVISLHGPIKATTEFYFSNPIRQESLL